MIIDSHAHLDNEKLDYRKIVSNMQTDGLSKIITIGTNVKQSKNAIKIAQENKNVYCAVGIHPEYANETTEEDLKIIDKLCDEKKVVAVGEIGLDYYYEGFDKEKQKWLFVEQLKIASKHNLPVSLHIREATGDVVQILRENKGLLKAGGVAHCFSGSIETAKIFIGLGLYISFSGRITFKSVNREILQYLPLDKILVETDCPFLSPEPVRGTVNEPKNVNWTAKKIADELDLSFEEICKITSQNCIKLFKNIE